MSTQAMTKIMLVDLQELLGRDVDLVEKARFVPMPLKLLTVKKTDL